MLNWQSVRSQDYRNYHNAITKAEKQSFCDSQIQAGLSTYTKTFDKYDFVFAHDCVNAIQLAIYANDTLSFLRFLKKSVQNGVMPRHLLKISYIKKSQLYQSYLDTVVTIYNRNHPHYLKRIDTIALRALTELYAIDQMEKNYLKNENGGQHISRYKPQIKRTMGKLRGIIADKGFPGDKLIGIGQNDILSELKTGSPDLIEYYHKYKGTFNISIGQYTIDEYLLASNYYYPLIHHYSYTYATYNVYNDSFYLDQIIKGNIHPKDVAYIKDIRHSISSGNKDFKFNPGEAYFATGIYPPGTKFPMEDSNINAYRKLFYISRIEHDSAKGKFMQRHGMFNSWGYYGSRW